MNQDYLWIESLKFNDQGLIPAIAQDAQDGTILMMAWMNKESIQKTLETKEVHYWSRSRSELWHKLVIPGREVVFLNKLNVDC
ncbi:hypothetical protein L2E81_07390 [Planktothrix agardhii 1033]|nr:hypothetical protein [Planktothrix agardhii 1033]